MKRILVCTALALGVALAVPSAASAWHGGGGWHGGGWHGGFGGFHGGFGGWRGGWGGPRFGFYPAYYGPYGCWRWVNWPYPHRVWACY
jgi:hypothetical protein